LVPDFFFPEIGNIFWKRIRRGETTLEQALLSLNELKGVNLQIRSSFPLMTMAFFGSKFYPEMNFRANKRRSIN
jgi:predicted nucleic acid-binding protein